MRRAALVLLVEGDAELRAARRAGLEKKRIRVVDAASGDEAAELAAAHAPDVVVIGHGAAGLDAPRVSARIRERTGAPIVILVAPDERLDEVAALVAGANDYVSEPVSLRDLLARIRVWLRHARRAGLRPRGTTLEVGELGIDFASHRVFVRGVEVRLTEKEYSVLAVLMRNPGKVLTHEQLTATVWGPRLARSAHYLPVCIQHLRRKLARRSRRRYIESERGVGYRLRPA